MAKLSEIINYMEEKYPEKYCPDWDNPGLLVDCGERDITKVILSIDVDEKVIAEAEDFGAELIITHHPIMFGGIKKIQITNFESRIIAELIRKNITLFSAHTNLDKAEGGLNDFLCRKLEITNTVTTEPEDYDSKVGFGRIGEVCDGLKLSDMLKICKKNLNADCLRYVGDESKPIKKVAVNCGGGADEFELCERLGVDLLITGDAKYPLARSAKFSNTALIDAGHFETEHIVSELLYSTLSKKFKDVEFKESKAIEPAFKFYK